MARKRALTMITLSVVMGVIAAWMAANLILNASKENEVKMANVVAADLAIPFGTKVERRHLKTLEMPAEFVPPGSFDNFEDVIDRVTVQPIVAGEILMQGRFVDYDDGTTLAAMVSKQMRAVTVRVDDVIGVAGFLLPGNRVDVLAARREANRRASAETILRDVKVLAVDQTAATEKNEPVIVRAVTLEVTPDQAEVLVKAKEEGSIQLTLRNPLEEEVVVAEAEPEPEPKPAAAPVPAPAPRPRAAPRPRSYDVTVIRGTAVTETKPNS
jgi:pilus assembly protein CpaB